MRGEYGGIFFLFLFLFGLVERERERERERKREREGGEKKKRRKEREREKRAENGRRNGLISTNLFRFRFRISIRFERYTLWTLMDSPSDRWSSGI